MDNTSHDHDQQCWARDWLTAEHDIVHMPIASLRPGDSPRLEGESKDHTTSMVEVTETPPIILHQPTMQVIDGVHRLQAAILRGQNSIAAWLFDGTAEEAFVLAVAANITHGLPLTTKDRKAAAGRILGMYPDWSDRMIASTAGVSPGTVAAVRSECSTAQSAQLNTRTGRDGRKRPLNANEGRLAATELIQADPSMSDREVARRAGISVGTVHNVRAQLTQGVEPLVAKSHGAGLNVHLARARAVLTRLWNDRAVRSPAEGKAMLELLSHSLRTSGEAQAASRSAPEYCRDAMAEFALACGDSWHRVAKDLRSKTQAG